MKSGYVYAVAALVVGVGATLAVNSYLSMKSELASVQESAKESAKAQEESVKAQPPIAQPVATIQPTQVSVAAPAPNFEQLSLCEQLDAVAKSGKSVAQFIADSGRYSDFEAHVKANCNWNAEQLKYAYAILNPPVITIPKIIYEEPKVVPATPAPSPAPIPWNNCNGIKDAGETYSQECEDGQKHNDLNPNGPQNPIDHRPDVNGQKTNPNGFYIDSESSAVEASESNSDLADTTPQS